MADCKKLLEEQLDFSRTAWQKTLDDVAIYVKDQKDKGLDPEKFNPGPGKSLVNLYELTKDYITERDKQLKEIEEQFKNECNGDMVEIAQSLVDIAVARYSKGISLILPKHMTHIDVKEILDGKPLGGENSIVNQARGAMMRGLGIDENSDLGKVILNPTAVAKKTLDDAKDEVNKGLEKLGIPVRL